MKRNIQKVLYTILVILVCWTTCTNIIQAFKCPEMTRTELFLNLPKSFVCDFTVCE